MSRVNRLDIQPHLIVLLLFGLATAMPMTAAAQPATPEAGVAAITVEGCLTRDASKGQTSAAEQYVLTLPASP